VTFEGQAAIALEAAAESGVEERYDFETAGDPIELDFRPVITAIVKDSARGRRVSEISACFHNTLSAAIAEVCSQIGGPDRVCLSGGSFQNLYLLDRTVVELRRRGFAVFLHAQVPANDGGLALGQAMIANQRLREGV
jgi:hydrogenase maturation protein HypF